MAWAETYLHAKCHLDLSSRLATIDMGRKLGGSAAFFLGGGSWVPIHHNVAWAEVYLCAKFHLDPFNRLATVHQRYRQRDRRDESERDECDESGKSASQMLLVLMVMVGSDWQSHAETSVFASHVCPGRR